jgi:hypothetical protein
MIVTIRLRIFYLFEFYLRETLEHREIQLYVLFSMNVEMFLILRE